MSRRAILHGVTKKVWVDNTNDEACYWYENLFLRTGFCLEGWIMKYELCDKGSINDTEDSITTDGPILLELYDVDPDDEPIDDYDDKVKRIIEDTNVILEKLLG